jgi:Flp pilus assembly protein TadG
MPIALIVLTGLLSFGVYLNKSLELTNATSLAGQYLAVSRGSTAANTDPCAVFVSAFQNVAPFLQASSLSYSFAFTSVSPAFTGNYSGTSCTAAVAGMQQGASATINVTYPCSLGIYGIDLAPGCQLQSQVTEIIQ